MVTLLLLTLELMRRGTSPPKAGLTQKNPCLISKQQHLLEAFLLTKL
jgi:hypothetical protein